MPRRITFTGTVTEGRVKPDTSVPSLPWEGKRVRVTIERVPSEKTLSQLAYYWVELVPSWGEHAGYFPDEMHEALWLSFGPQREVENRLTGEVQMIRPRVSDYTTAEMSEYIDRLTVEGAQRGIPIRPPSYRS